MKSILRLSAVGAVCLSVLGAAHAAPLFDASKMFYVPVSVGEYFPADGRNMHSAFAGSAGLGYNINSYFAVQGDFTAFAPENRTTQKNISSYYLNMDGRFNLANSSHFLPYVVLGAGALKTTNTQVAMDYGVGMDYLFSRTFSVGANFRSLHQFVNSRNDELAMIGATFSFGGPKPEVAQPAPANPSGLNATQQRMLGEAQTSLASILPNGVSLCKGNHVGNQAGCVTFDGNIMTMHLNVRFMQNKSTIQGMYGTPIKSLGKFMDAYPQTRVSLYGYASSEGPKAFNQKLSTERAATVKTYLVNVSHVQASRITVVGMGTQDPIASNSTLAGRQLNRRVEATVPVPAQLAQ